MATQGATRIPGVQHLIGRVVGVGIRPEHIRTPAAPPSPLVRFAVAAGVTLAIAVNIGRALRRSR